MCDESQNGKRDCEQTMWQMEVEDNRMYALAFFWRDENQSFVPFKHRGKYLVWIGFLISPWGTDQNHDIRS